jgi:hypothetical protein
MDTFRSVSRAAGPAVNGDTQSISRTLARVVLQEVPTGRYYQGPGVWVTEEAHALDFRTGSAAMECAGRLNLTNVQVVMTQEFRERQTFPLKANSKPADQT